MFPILIMDCVRYLSFFACANIAHSKGDDDFRLSFIVEDGPWASGAADVYSRVTGAKGKWRPPPHGKYLNGFAVVPKGEMRSLEAADYLAGIANQRLLTNTFKKSEHPQASILLNERFLRRWYRSMIDEKERRRAHSARKRGGSTSPARGGES